MMFTGVILHRAMVSREAHGIHQSIMWRLYFWEAVQHDSLLANTMALS